MAGLYSILCWACPTAKPLRDMFLGCHCSTPRWGERCGQHHLLGRVPALCALSGGQFSPEYFQLRPDVPGLQGSSELVKFVLWTSAGWLSSSGLSSGGDASTLSGSRRKTTSTPGKPES